MNEVKGIGDNGYSKYVDKIDKELFKRPKGIHGVTHAKRVLYLALEIASWYSENPSISTQKYEITQEDIKILALACCYHDIGRNRDIGEHARASVTKVKNIKLLENENLSDDNVNLVLSMILNHEKKDNDDDLLCNGTEREKLLQKILKDADALDRVRLSKYNLRADKLRLTYSHDLIGLSQKLIKKIPKRGL